MTYWALIKAGIVGNVAVGGDPAWLAAVTAEWDAVVDVTATSPRPAKGWTYAGGIFTPPVVPNYLRPISGQFGVFFQAYTEEGYRWYYLVGPVFFAVADATPASTAQPTATAARNYAKANSTDDQFRVALTWTLDYRDRIAAGLLANGITDPTTNARYVKCQNLAATLGSML